MARLPVPVEELIRLYGPHLNSAPPGGWEAPASDGETRLVKTHCCFCGQQCGIQLKVRENTVVGFEPWEDFPFNRGMLCPKGVKRYLQGSHPDRLTSAYRRDPNAPGFSMPENMLRIDTDRGYVLQTGRVILADQAARLAENQDVRRAYLGEI